MAQDAVPMDILNRTFRIRFGNQAGTGFVIQMNHQLYLITARHVVDGAPVVGAVIQILQGGEWRDYPTVKTLFPSSNDVDIAVFQTNEKVDKPYFVETGQEGG